MCDIALAVRGADEVVFATGDAPGNELARAMVEAKGVRFFIGSETDVLGRFCSLVESTRHEHIVRVTCDNYLVQPEIIEAMLAAAMSASVGYAYVRPLSHYAGEYIHRDVLLAASQSPSPQAREHVTWDIRAGHGSGILALPEDFCGLFHPKSPTLDSIDDFVTMKRLEMDYPGLVNPRCLSLLSTIPELNP
jgi:spore coat polysaccharide biosynthesis protein SpsF (cytidylyltransferase family)